MINGEYQVIKGRPKIKVDYDVILRLRDVENLGWSRAASQYREITGTWISRETFKRRYIEITTATARLEKVFEDIRNGTWLKKV